MKQILSIFLIFALLIQPISKVWIIVSYQIYQEKITQEFCENIDKPELECNGKCYLKKQLAKDQESTSKIPDVLKQKAEVLFYQSPFVYQFSLSFPTVDVHRLMSFYLMFIPIIFLSNIFRPPIL
jgi:hypothetical protein